MVPVACTALSMRMYAGLKSVQTMLAMEFIEGTQPDSDDAQSIVSQDVQKLIEKVLSWQKHNKTHGVLRIPNQHAIPKKSKEFYDDSEERNLGSRLAKVLIRRHKSLGPAPSQFSYRHLKWLWSIRCQVYLFMDARQQLPATATWINTNRNFQSCRMVMTVLVYTILLTQRT